MKFNFTKFTLPALLLAASASAFADEQPVVKLTGIDEPITWSAFVNAINNPTQVKGEVDPESDVAKTYVTADNDLQAANKAKAEADAELKAAQLALNGGENEAGEEVVGATAALATAKKNQGDALTTLNAAKNAYTAANEEYQTALGDQSVRRDSVSSREKMLAAANQNVANKQAQIKEQITDVLASKKATFESNKTAISNAETQADVYKDMRDNYVQITYEKETAKWLKDARDDAEIFRNSFKPNGTATDIDLYYKANVNTTTDYDDEDKEITITNVTLMISFVPQDGWYSNKINTAYTDIRDKYTDIKNTTIINRVQIYFGYTDGKPNYGTNSILTIAPSVKYSLVYENIATAIEGIDEKNYQVDGTTGTQTITNQAQYDKYNGLYEAENTKIETLTNTNKTLEKEISDLETKINTKDDQLYKDLETLQQKVTDIDGKLKGFEQQLADDTAIVNKYRATKDAEGNSYIGADKKPVTYLNYLYYQQTLADNAKTAADEAVATANQNLTNAQNAVNTANTNVSNAANEVRSAQTAFNAANTAYQAAKKAADEAATAAAQAKYNEITLSGDINATEPITKAYSGTIYAEGHVINVNMPATATQTSLFNAFSGHVDDAAINGTFAKNLAGATFTDVARWDGDGKIYSDNGTPTEYNSSELQDAFGAFGYALRNNKYFGVDFNGTKVVNKADAPSKVFSLTAYDVPAGVNDTEPVATQTYVQLSEAGSSDMVYLKNNVVTAYTVPENRFAASATADVAGLGLTNVYYGTNNTCENVVIIDRNDFYCPVTVTATTIDYSRELKGGYNSVCLPFQLNKDDMPSSVLSICEYESVDYNTKKFWFKENATTIKANTPTLIVLEEGAANVKLNLSNVAIAATDKSQLTKSDAMYGNTQSYGTFKKAHVSEFEGMQYKDYIYGLNTSGNFIAAAANATFPAFRMVIGTASAVNPKSLNGAADYSVMGIGIHDEYGNDVTNDQMSGVDDVVADAADAITVAGGQGEIIITAKADFGKVEIYNLNGMLIEVADIVEGTTTIGVSKGFYIVMGQKVLVK